MHHKAIALMAIFLVMATLANGAPMKIIFTIILFSSAANSNQAEDTLHLPSEKESHSYTTSLALFLPLLWWTPFSKIDYKFPLVEIKVQRTPTENNFICQSDSKKNEDDKLKHTCFRSLHLSRWGRRRWQKPTRCSWAKKHPRSLAKQTGEPPPRQIPSQAKGISRGHLGRCISASCLWRRGWEQA